MERRFFFRCPSLLCVLFFSPICWRQVDIGLGEAPSKDIVCILDEDKSSGVDTLNEF